MELAATFAIRPLIGVPRPMLPSAARLALVATLTLGPTIGCAAPPSEPARAERWTMWVTDLYEPVNDPDDHYDLADGWLDAGTSLIV